ncbi:MAG: HEAT repeat domain-containing protein [Candidatus Altiarchaeota archaeon]
MRRQKRIPGELDVNAYLDSVGRGDVKEVVDRLLTGRDCRDRCDAAFMMGVDGDVNLVPVLSKGLNDPDQQVREKTVSALERIGGVKVVEPLTKALFDRDRFVRRSAVRALKKMRGLRYVVEAINEHYPGDSLGGEPAEFFLVSSGKDSDVGDVLRESGVRISEVFEDGSPALGVGMYSSVREDYRRAGSYRGLPVFTGDVRQFLAKHVDGAIIIDDGVPERFRDVRAAHEFGETWSHEVGLAFELLLLEDKPELFRDLLESMRAFGAARGVDYTREYAEVVKSDPDGFAGFKRFFPEDFQETRGRRVA